MAMSATQHRPLMNLPAGGEPAGGKTFVAISHWTYQGLMGRDQTPDLTPESALLYLSSWWVHE